MIRYTKFTQDRIFLLRFASTTGSLRIFSFASLFQVRFAFPASLRSYRFASLLQVRFALTGSLRFSRFAWSSLRNPVATLRFVWSSLRICVSSLRSAQPSLRFVQSSLRNPVSSLRFASPSLSDVSSLEVQYNFLFHKRSMSFNSFKLNFNVTNKLT